MGKRIHKIIGFQETKQDWVDHVHNALLTHYEEHQKGSCCFFFGEGGGDWGGWRWRKKFKEVEIHRQTDRQTHGKL